MVEESAELVQRLIEDLRGAGILILPGTHTREYVITEDRGGPVVPPITLVATDGELRQCVERIAADAQTLWPDVEPFVAGYRLLLVHIEEHLYRLGKPIRALTFSDGDLVVTQPDDYLEPSTPATGEAGDTYRWTTHLGCE